METVSGSEGLKNKEALTWPILIEFELEWKTCLLHNPFNDAFI
jgi:hypothetical protein